MVDGLGVSEDSLTSADLRSANGTYGAACHGRAGTAWSVAISMSAPLDNAALAVVRGNSACLLTLTELRVGAGTLYTASAGIVLASAYAASSTVFTASGASITVNAKLSTASFSSDFTVSVLHSQDSSLATASKAAFYSYDTTISNTTGLVSYWRLAETGPFVLDTFSGATGGLLANHTGEVGAGWTRHAGSAGSVAAYISNANRVRANDSDDGIYYASGSPPSADYSVSADLVVVSKIESDASGVIGRVSTSTESYYFAGYEITSDTGIWELRRVVNGAVTVLDTYSQTLTTGATYQIALEMHGSSIRMTIDGVERCNATDSAITAAGKAGLMVGKTAIELTSPSNTQGMHIDNLQATTFAEDTYGTVDGSYQGGVTFGATGAIASSASTAITLNGSDGFVLVNRGIADDFSLELWFRASVGTGAASVAQWYNTAGLIDGSVIAEVCSCGNFCCSTTRYGFGIGLRSDGRVLAGITVGANDKTIVPAATTSYLDNIWHHVVFTRNKLGGALVLYVDGASVGALTSAATASISNSTRISIGRIHTGANYFSGSLDEVAVYSTYLPPATVLKHYQVGKQ
jgi:hypothetical protein